jgi:nucleoid-associated protein YgaU
MTRTDFSSSAKPHIHRRISLRQPLRCGFAILLCSCLFAGAAQCRAQASQDVAEAARQERARKDAKKHKHVYTDEDLHRAKILTPDDEARVEARGKQQPAPVEEQAQAPVDADGQIGQLPLGDIARRYRNAKLAAQMPDNPFHLPFDEPVFAAPVLPVPAMEAARPAFSPGRPNPAPARRNAVVPPSLSSPAPLRRVDPFARRLAPPAPASVARIAPAMAQPKVAAPVAPVVKPHAIAPAIAPSTSAPRASAPASIAPPLATVAKPSLLPHTVTVRPGDSLWKLAQQNLGRGSRWQELLAANPGIVDPMRIAAGTEIVVPAKLTTLKSDVRVTVKEGDTLSRIAQFTYGRAAAWRCIAHGNPEIADVNRIYKGQQLLLPFACQQ